MTAYPLAFLIGIIAGLRAMTSSASASNDKIPVVHALPRKASLVP